MSVKLSTLLGKYLGKVYYTTEGYPITIVGLKNYRDVQAQFENGYVVNTRIDVLELGNIRNPHHLSVFGIGYMGVGKYNYKNSKDAYKSWQRVLGRTNNYKSKDKQLSYKDVIVCEEWKCFQNFAEWYYENWKSHMKGWQLDKDILLKGNKIYSPETCCFVPNKINVAFVKDISRRGKYLIGVCMTNKLYYSSIKINGDSVNLGYYKTELGAFYVYKTAKENYIKRLASEWRSLIEPSVYNTMINYKVEKTD